MRWPSHIQHHWVPSSASLALPQYPSSQGSRLHRTSWRGSCLLERSGHGRSNLWVYILKFLETQFDSFPLLLSLASLALSKCWWFPLLCTRQKQCCLFHTPQICNRWKTCSGYRWIASPCFLWRLVDSLGICCIFLPMRACRCHLRPPFRKTNLSSLQKWSPLWNLCTSEINLVSWKSQIQAVYLRTDRCPPKGGWSRPYFQKPAGVCYT